MHAAIRTLLLSTLLLPGSLLAQTTDHTHDGGIRCATSLLHELRIGPDGTDSKGVSVASLGQNFARQQMDRSIVSPDGHFRVHFDLTGFNAVPPTDRDGNGVPDFVDSAAYYLDEAWRVIVEECGWLPPPPDNVAPGVGGPDGLLDAYLLEQEGDYYGLANPDVGGAIGTTKASGYLVLDNDYREFSTRGIEGLRVTSAHEFHHLVQFAAYRYDLSQLSLYEATSTYMEYKVHPEVRDYFNYVDTFQRAPQKHPFSTNNTQDRVTGYAHMSYLLFLAERTEQDIVRSIWQSFAQNGAQFTAINAALLASDLSLNLSTSYCAYARAMYATGARSPDPPTIPLGNEYGTMRAVATYDLEPDEPRTIAGSLSPLGFGIWRFLLSNPQSETPDTLDFLITNARSNLGIGGRQWINNPEPFTLMVSRTPGVGFLPITFRNDTIYYRADTPHAEFCIDPFINGSNGIVITSRPSPQPFVNDGGSEMVFALNLDPSEVVGWRLEIYSIDMKLIAEETGTSLEQVQNLRGVRWNGRDRDGGVASSGVYIYVLQINDREPVIGKIAVVHP